MTGITERIKTSFYFSLPEGLKSNLYQQYIMYGLKPYLKNNWDELLVVTNHLVSHYKMAL